MSIILNEKGAEWLKQLNPIPDQREFFAKRAAKIGIKSYNITRTTINSPQKPRSADNDHIKGEIKIMVTVLDVARYILDHVGETSAWKLQKLCYYAQAWSIAWTEKPLFAEEFEAWRNGPVCPVLFRLHQGQFTVKPEDIPGHPEVLTADELETLNIIIRDYGEWQPHELREQTHSEAPWKDARGNLPANAPCNTVITKESMGAFYGSL